MMCNFLIGLVDIYIIYNVHSLLSCQCIDLCISIGVQNWIFDEIFPIFRQNIFIMLVLVPLQLQNWNLKLCWTKLNNTRGINNNHTFWFFQFKFSELQWDSMRVHYSPLYKLYVLYGVPRSKRLNNNNNLNK